jgi:hypothetical protein
MVDRCNGQRSGMMPFLQPITSSVLASGTNNRPVPSASILVTMTVPRDMRQMPPRHQIAPHDPSFNFSTIMVSFIPPRRFLLPVACRSLINHLKSLNHHDDGRFSTMGLLPPTTAARALKGCMLLSTQC